MTTRLGIAAIVLMAAASAAAEPQATPPPGDPLTYAAVPGFADDDLARALVVFRASCKAFADKTQPLRPALPPPPALRAVCDRAAALPADAGRAVARRFFETQFTPRRVGAPGSAFFTGYYEPVVDGSLVKTAKFGTPLYGRPADLVAAEPGRSFPGLDPTLAAARRLPDGSFAALPDRAAIDGGALGATARPVVYVSDAVEAFFIQIQGSARIALPDGRLRRLVYAGRNGYPYTSIGKVLAQTLHIPPADMGMAQLKTWIRTHGQEPGEPGALLMEKNRSYIFFAFDDSLPADAGPIGASGVSVTGLRSLAVDRSRWCYGLPMYADAMMAWRGKAPTPFRRLLVAQDTGSAIVGPARADIFFGTGPEAAQHAGTTRASGTLFVLWPKADPP